MELRQYHAEDMIVLLPPSGDRATFAQMCEQSKFAYSVFDADKCIGCAGIMRVAGKIYYMWAVVGEDLRRNRLWLHRSVRRYLPLWLANTDWVRVEALVEADNRRACRWIESLGFSLESCKRRGGDDGKDAFIYAMVKD